MHKLTLSVIFFFVACLAGFGSDMYLAGSINNKFPVFMYLVIKEKTASGWYFYQSQGKQLTLNGQAADDGTIALTEKGPDGAVTGNFTGKLSNGVFEGKWKNTSTSYKFSLTMVAETMTSSLTEGESFTCTNDFPFFTGSARAIQLNEDIFQFSTERVKSFFENCYEFFSDIKEEDRNIPAPWTSELAYTINSYNDVLLSILFSCYEYMGGAHGNTYYFVKNYQLTVSGFKPLPLTDVVKSASIANGLSALIIADLKEQGASSATDGEKQSFQPDELSAFTITPAGINFHFAPYEVGAYAEGAFLVFIPYEKLKPFLTREMATLLKLNP